MREKQWQSYHRFEKHYKDIFLKKLSERSSVNILRQLYGFVYNLSGKPNFNTLNRDKIKALARIHSLFGRVEV